VRAESLRSIAARLESIAEPGAILVSRAVRDSVRDKLGVALEDLGEKPVKNIARPVRVFRISRADGAGADATTPNDDATGRIRLYLMAIELIAQADVENPGND
jgi:hypothetical protein